MIDQENELAIFIHVPKSAGTSFRFSVINGGNYSLSGYNIMAWHGTTTKFKEEISIAKREQVKLLTGHCCFGIHEAFSKPAAYLSIIRHPVDRIVSYFYQTTFTLNNKPIPMTRSKLLDPETFEKLLAARMVSQNQAVQLLSGAHIPIENLGEEHLQMAKNNIDKYFSFICCTEDLDNYWDLLSNKFGYKWHSNDRIKKSDMHIDHDTVRPKLEDIPPYIKTEIAKTHSLDVMLYNYVKSIQDEINNREIVYCHPENDG